MSWSTTTERFSRKERHEKILAQLRSNVAVRISVLAEQFGVSTETVRRDIDQLTAAGHVNRTYGGATATLLASEPGILQRDLKNFAERKRIARHAASLIEPDDVLMIDGGSTTHQFARALSAREMNLTILTNCLPVAQVLAAVPSFRIVLCPGDYSHAEQGVYGHEATLFLARFHANKAVLGAGGLTEKEVTDPDSRACWLKRQMIEQSERTIVLLDRSKFGVRLFETVCPLEDIADLVTDERPPKAVADALAKSGTRLHVAARDSTGEADSPR